MEQFTQAIVYGIIQTMNSAYHSKKTSIVLTRSNDAIYNFNTADRGDRV